MDLLDRYLAAIARELPKHQARDIIAELRDTLLSQIEEKEEAFGRALTRPELEVVLHDFGHPLVVAARYGRTQQLIGPELFPFWWATLRAVLAIAVAVWFVLMILSAGGAHRPGAVVFAQALPNLWTGGLFLFGAVTLVFVVIEQAGGARFLRRWNPANLPSAGGKSRSRFDLTAEIAVNLVFILWWTGVIHFRSFLPMPGGMQVDFAPVWIELHWVILGSAALVLAVNAVELARPDWPRVNAGLSLARHLFGLAIVVYALRAGHWIVVSSPTIPPAVLPQVQAGFDTGMWIGLIVTAFGIAGAAIYDVWRFIRASSGIAAGARPNCA